MAEHESSGTVAGEVKAGAREALDAGKERTRSFFEEQKGVLATKVSGFANALHESARNLEQGDGRGTATLAHRMADGMDRIARSMEDRDLRGILDDAEDLARRSPAAFVGGAVSAGFLLARFLKSSRERREAASGQTYGAGGEYGSPRAYGGGYSTPSESYRTAERQRPGESYRQPAGSQHSSGERHEGYGQPGPRSASERYGQTDEQYGQGARPGQTGGHGQSGERYGQTGQSYRTPGSERREGQGREIQGESFDPTGMGGGV